jgi:Trk K+ transport system NAD-binding subunit
LALVEIGLPERDSGVCSKKVSELQLPENTVLVAVIRGEQIVVTRGNTMLEAGDRVIAVTPIEQEKALRRLLTEG